MFPLSNRLQHLPVFAYSPENFLISSFIKPGDLSILLHIHISKASNLLSVCVNVHVSAAYSAALQNKHVIISTKLHVGEKFYRVDHAHCPGQQNV